MAPLFGLGIAFVWFFGIIDAVRQAKAINSGYVNAGGLATSEATALRRAESMAGLTWGVILVGIGALWLLDRYVDLDAFWAAVEDWLAPVAFIMLGLVLIVTYVAKKRRHNASEVWPPRT
jgi:CDP-diglyceride synthetase